MRNYCINSSNPPPAWTEDASRFLPEPRFWGYLPQTRALMLAETPGPFRRRNLFCGYIWLRSDRWDHWGRNQG